MKTNNRPLLNAAPQDGGDQSARTSPPGDGSTTASAAPPAAPAGAPGAPTAPAAPAPTPAAPAANPAAPAALDPIVRPPNFFVPAAAPAAPGAQGGGNQDRNNQRLQAQEQQREINEMRKQLADEKNRATQIKREQEQAEISRKAELEKARRREEDMRAEVAAATAAAKQAEANSKRQKRIVASIIGILILLLLGLGVLFWLNRNSNPSTDNPAKNTANRGGGVSGGPRSFSGTHSPEDSFDGGTGIIRTTNSSEQVFKRTIPIEVEVLVTNKVTEIRETHRVTDNIPNGGQVGQGGYPPIIFNPVFSPVNINGNNNTGNGFNNGAGWTNQPPHGTNNTGYKPVSTFQSPGPKMAPEVKALVSSGRFKTYEAVDGILPECIHVGNREVAIILIPPGIGIQAMPLNQRNVAYYYDDRSQQEENDLVARTGPSQSLRLYIVNRETALSAAQQRLIWSSASSTPTGGSIASN